jgi:hypothetical protein
MSTVEQITYEDFLDTCKTNGLYYIVVGRQRFLFPVSFVSLPCRSIEQGREIINGFRKDGVEGYFYIRELSFQEDPWHTRLKKWLVHYR